MSAAEVEAELGRIDHELKPLDIVLVNTRAGSRYGRNDYIHSGCGMGRDATLFLTSRGVRVTGTDGWSWDAPFLHTAKRFAASKDPSIIWEGHKAGRTIGYCHIERLHNLEILPASGFVVACFPVKIRGASALLDSRGRYFSRLVSRLNACVLKGFKRRHAHFLAVDDNHSRLFE